jgi:hypothetical protein
MKLKILKDLLQSETPLLENDILIEMNMKIKMEIGYQSQ